MGNNIFWLIYLSIFETMTFWATISLMRHVRRTFSKKKDFLSNKAASSRRLLRLHAGTLKRYSKALEYKTTRSGYSKEIDTLKL
jgi:hypothetical protein